MEKLEENNALIEIWQELDKLSEPEEDLIPISNKGLPSDLIEEIEEYLNPPKKQGRDLFAIHWLAREIKVSPEKLLKILKAIRNREPVYTTRYKSKKHDGKRKIYIPNPLLKEIQKNINKHILEFLNPAKNAFGFSSGGVEDTIKPHLTSKCILCVDFSNAFPTIKEKNVLGYFTEGRTVLKKENYGREKIKDMGYFSWYAAKAITDLTTYDGSINQGPPTSPRLFDLICRPIDQKLQKLAEKVKGKYTRYADNVFFSINKNNFSRPLRQAILKIIEGRRTKGAAPHLVGFTWHSLRIKKTGDKAIRILGLNIINNKIHNTRSFKRRLRLAIHHINWLLDNDRDYKEVWQKLKGQMSFAKRDTLPLKLLGDYQKLEKRIT